MDRRGPDRDPASAAFRRTWPLWLPVAVFSTAVNLLMFTGALYMLQVYDRVLASRSVPTLVALSVIALAAFALQGVLDAIRQRLLVRLGAMVDMRLAPLAARATHRATIAGAAAPQALQPLRDLDAVRGYLSGIGPTAIIDMPFMPVFIAGCFLLHPWIGWLTVAGAVAIVFMTLAAERRSKEPSQVMQRSSAEQSALVESSRRNAEAIAGLGMSRSFAARFAAIHERHVDDTMRLADSISGVQALSKMFRFALQSAVLGLGAYLAIQGQMSAGAMIAGSILTSRALAPIEVAVAHWKGFVAARQGYARLRQSLLIAVEKPREFSLPPPSRSLRVDHVAVVPPGAPDRRRTVVFGASLSLAAGEVLALVGPSGSGKSSLARAIVGVWPVAQGEIRLDDATTTQWDPDLLGRSIGYLPQDIELFDGTVADNIARFDPDVDSGAVLKAATAAGADAMIRALPQGYNTRIGEAGAVLSGGQRQRVALARALYGDPFLLVLDEPNSSLDEDGTRALARAIGGAKDRGAIVILIVHNPLLYTLADHVAEMRDGQIVRTMTGREAMAALRAQMAQPAEATRGAPPPSPPAQPPRRTGAPVVTVSPAPVAPRQAGATG
jgi:ATP-binding cassette subfamily C protein